MKKPFVSKRILLGLASIAVGFTVLASSVQAETETPINGIAAVVNSSVITQQELNQQVNLISSRLKKNKVTLPSETVFRDQVLQQMISRQLQLQQAKKLNLTVSSKQIDDAMQRIAKHNKLTVAKLYASAEKDGYSKQAFQNEIKKEILMQEAESDEVASRISISEQQVNDYLNIYRHSKSVSEYRLGDILIALPGSPSPSQVSSAKAKAEKIVKALKAGTSFKKLAVANSANPQALQGSALPWQKLAELPTPFVPYAKQMKVGAVAGPIRTPNGFHVIKLVAKQSGGLQGTAAQQKKEVEQMIFERELKQAAMNWVAQLRTQSYIKVFPAAK